MSAAPAMEPSDAGRLWIVGLGPGDPGLVTLRAAELVRAAAVVAYHHAPGRSSVVRGIAEAAGLLGEQVEEPLTYPVTTGEADHAGGYYGAMADFYDECEARVRAHLDAGRDVALLAEGDPMFYGSAMYLHDRLREEFSVEVVAGVTAFSAAAAVGTGGLCRHEDVLTVLPGTLGAAELARRLADTDAAVIMKLGRTFPEVVDALRQAGRLEDAVYVERASREDERVLPVTDVDPAEVPYMSIVLVPGRDRRADVAGRAGRAGFGGLTALPGSETTEAGEAPAVGTVHVVGLGPGPDKWLSPEASDVLAATQHVIGYAPYVDRVPQREGLTRHASGNTVEVDRGRLALDLALAGDDVTVVSGGDAGVFGMAAAVFEAAETDERYDAVNVHVVPGITAAHAASALVGAVMGADHTLISLSDRLKPWSVVVDRLTAAARADLVIGLYNPRSRSRPEQLFAAREALLDAVGGERVVLIARHVGRAEESVHVTTLAEFDPGMVDMGCLVVIGASSTRVSRTGRVWTPRYVES